MKIRMTVALLLLSVSAMPALAQNRFMDQAREAAERRAENKAIREAEHPAGVASTAKPAPAQAAQAAPAEPAEPAAPAPATPAPAPATPAQ